MKPVGISHWGEEKTSSSSQFDPTNDALKFAPPRSMASERPWSGGQSHGRVDSRSPHIMPKSGQGRNAYTYGRPGTTVVQLYTPGVGSPRSSSSARALRAVITMMKASRNDAADCRLLINPRIREQSNCDCALRLGVGIP